MSLKYAKTRLNSRVFMVNFCDGPIVSAGTCFAQEYDEKCRKMPFFA